MRGEKAPAVEGRVLICISFIPSIDTYCWRNVICLSILVLILNYILYGILFLRFLSVLLLFLAIALSLSLRPCFFLRPTDDAWTRPSLSSDDEDENSSLASSKLLGILPSDQGRWKFSKAAEQARINFTQQLKEFDIANKEDNWNKFDSVFHTMVESLELHPYVFDPVMPAPMSHSELMRACGNNDGNYCAEQIIPGMYRDFLGRIFHKDPTFQGVEIVHEEEKRRFNSAMVLLYSVLSSCTSSARLDGIMDRENARGRKNVPLIYRFLTEHFVLLSGTSITQKMLKVCSIARYDPNDEGAVKAIETRERYSPCSR